MIFNEIYSCYYNVVFEILNSILDNNFNEENIYDIINKKAFSESFLFISKALKNEYYQLIYKDKTGVFKTPIKNKFNIPLSNIEKRWLKSIIDDPRIKLFDCNINFDFLDNIKPLFKIDDYYIFDKSNDGDPYDNLNYINNFKSIIYAIKNEKKLKIKYVSKKNKLIKIVCSPYKIEYSQKDDKFRVIISKNNFLFTMNIARIKECKILESSSIILNKNKEVKKFIILNLYDGRNALERVMLHFAHFEKETERINNNKYNIKIYYYEDDENEMVVRILSFGQFIRVIEPQEFVNLIVNKLKQQKRWNL